MRRLYRATLSRWAQPFARRLAGVAAQCAAVSGRIWRRLDAVDIPLSPLQWISVLYLAFGILYAFATPVFEANDEIWHFGYIQHLRETGALPVQIFDGRDTLYQQHGSQPPLYYGAMALLTAPFSIDDSEQYRRLNPHVSADEPAAFGNKNLILHDEDRSLLRGTGLVVMLLRFAGLALGLGTIACVYKIGELVAPQRPTVAYVAAALTGLNPMFIFVSASVTNDSLSAALNGLLVLLMLRCLRDGFSRRSSLSIALLFALSCLCKVTVFALLPVLIGVALYVYRKTRDRRGLLSFFYLLALVWLLIAGWWFLRNVQLYNEPFGLHMMANIAGPRGLNFNLLDLFGEYQQFRMSYWGLFGAQNIQVANIVYVLLDLATLAALFGAGFLLLQLLAISDLAYARYELAHLLTLMSALALLWLGILYWSALSPEHEGRMLFPLVAIVSPLLAVGLVEVVWWLVFSLRPPNLEFVRAGDAVPRKLLQATMTWQLRFLGIVALLAPITVIASQYTSPQPVAAAPGNASAVYARYGDVSLIAYERVDRRYNAGDQVRVKLYWQVEKPAASDNSILLTLVDDRGQAIGGYISYPGAGSLRSSRWQAGAIYPDEYLIDIHPAAHGRYPFALEVQWQDDVNHSAINGTDAAGSPIAPVRLNIGAVVTARYQAAPSGFNEIPLDSQPVFDDAIRLEAFQLDLELNEISLSWKAETTPEENYTVFVHLLDAAGAILSQADGSPRLPTRYWRWGETFTTHHILPAAHTMLEHTVIVGLYLNDGISNAKAEYSLSASAQSEAPGAALLGEPAGLAAVETEAAVDTTAEAEMTAEDSLDEEELVLDAYTIPWDIAAEALALTPSPEPTADAADDVDGGNQDAATAQERATAPPP